MRRSKPAPLVLTALLLLGGASSRHATAKDALAVQVAERAAEVLAAIAAGDTERLARLAAKDDASPWLVADALFAQGRLDAALSFAKAAPRPDVERLPSYVESLRGTPDEIELRARLAHALDVASSERYEEVVSLTEPGLAKPPERVLPVRFSFCRAAALANIRRYAEASSQFVATAGSAERLGWLSLAAKSLRIAGDTAQLANDFTAARDAYARGLVVAGRRGAVARRDSAEFQGVLADMLERMGERREAIALYREALATFEALDDPTWKATVRLSLGYAYLRSDDPAAAIVEVRRAAPQLEALGDRERAAWAATYEGEASMDLRRDDEARAALDRARIAWEALGNVELTAGATINLAILKRRAGANDAALPLFERGCELARSAGNGEWEANGLRGLVDEYTERGQLERAAPAVERLVAVAEAIREPGRAAWAMWQLGRLHLERSDAPKAVAAFARAIGYFEAGKSWITLSEALRLRGHTQHPGGGWRAAREAAERARTQALALNAPRVAGEIDWALGTERLEARDPTAAREHFTRARESLLAAGAANRAAEMLQEIAGTLAVQGDGPAALAMYEDALRASEGAGDRAAVATALGRMAQLHLNRGDLAKALPVAERALVLAEAIGDRHATAGALQSIGVIHTYRGEFAKALAADERALALQQALGDKYSVAGSLLNIGNVYSSLGDPERALGWAQRALAAFEALEALDGQALVLESIGSSHLALDRLEAAEESFARALALRERIGDELGLAHSRMCQANLDEKRQDWAAALRRYSEALPTLEARGDKFFAAWALYEIGVAHERLGESAKAMQFLDRAGRAGEKLGTIELQVASLSAVARVRLKLGDAGRAMDAAHRAVLLLKSVVGGLAEEQGAVVRGKYSDLFATGLEAAARNEDVAEAVFFLESGRAGSLLEALGGRGAAHGGAVPEELRVAEQKARAEEATALAAWDRATEGADRQEIRARKAALDDARARVAEVVERIQRDTKKSQLWYPVALPVEELQALLEPQEALVLYGLAGKDVAYAVVVSRADARIVGLGPVRAVVEACEGLDLGEPGGDPTAALQRVAALVVAPLGLPVEAKRVLVSPEGPLSYVPFAPLLPDRDLVQTASGSTYAELIGQRAARGSKILALADPDYRARFSPAALDIYALDRRGVAATTRGRTLAPLPGTRAEAEALADVKLLGADASEDGLREALRTHAGRWSSVHFACHGLVDPDRPSLSSLALTPDAAGNDGFLTALEVLRMQIPSDLVVLSACETGRGKIVTGEGIVGLTRAFMYAGAPRVICSLWKVDDDATRALMTKFYEVWKGGQVPAAAALRQAQAHIRAQPAWRHPYYWAAWTLWGLP